MFLMPVSSPQQLNLLTRKPDRPHTKPIRNWCVVMVNDDGRSLTKSRCRNYEEAERWAGGCRDGMTEDEVEAGWNYLPMLA